VTAVGVVPFHVNSRKFTRVLGDGWLLITWASSLQAKYFLSNVSDYIFLFIFQCR
jgi:hypothetical protein